MGAEFLELDCGAEADPYSKLREWRREQFEASKLCAVLSIVNEHDVRVQVELPPGKRLTGLGYWAVQNLESSGSGGVRTWISSGTSGDVTYSGWFESREDARRFAAAVLEEIAADLTEVRHDLAMTTTPRELYERQPTKWSPFWADSDNLGVEGLFRLSNEVREDFGIPEPADYPHNDWERDVRIVEAALAPHRDKLRGFEEILWLDRTTCYFSELAHWRDCSEEEGILEELPGTAHTTIEDFLKKNHSQEWRLVEPPDGDSRCKLVTSSECAKFDDFHTSHPRAQGILTMSRPGFNEAQDEALIEICNNVDLRLLVPSNAGKSTNRLRSLVLLRRVGQDWRIVESRTIEDGLNEALLRTWPEPEEREDDWKTPSPRKRQRSPDLEESLQELAGYTAASHSDELASLQPGEILWGVYENNRHQPERIYFTSRGMHLVSRWTEFYLPYRAIKWIDRGKEAYHLIVRLHDGRTLPLIIDRLERTDNLWEPRLDSDWFCDRFPFEVQRYRLP